MQNNNFFACAFVSKEYSKFLVQFFCFESGISLMNWLLPARISFILQCFKVYDTPPLQTLLFKSSTCGFLTFLVRQQQDKERTISLKIRLSEEVGLLQSIPLGHRRRGPKQKSNLPFLMHELLYVISGFRRDVDENCALQCHYAAQSCNSLPTFRDNLTVKGQEIQYLGSVCLFV